MRNQEEGHHLGVRSYAVLLALSEGERHGYDLMKQVALDSDNAIVMGPATLYTTLKRLLELQLIAESEKKSDGPHAAQRRYYRLSSTGRTALADELERSEKFSSLLRRRLA